MVLGNFEATDEERFALMSALEHNCSCADNAEWICPAHMLVRNDLIVKYMLFVRRTFDEWPAISNFKP